MSKEKLSTVTYRPADLLSPGENDYGTLENYVDGEWRESESGEFDDIYDPATMKHLYRAPRSTEDELVEAIEVAEEAFGEWRTTPPVDRARVMHRLTLIFTLGF